MTLRVLSCIFRNSYNRTGSLILELHKMCCLELVQICSVYFPHVCSFICGIKFTGLLHFF